jgi:two-component system, NtrC family, response regulator HydG
LQSNAKHIKKKIVLIDDDSLFLETLLKTLDPLTHQFEISLETFNSPIKAIQYIEKNHENISVIVTDFHMPDMNGVELIQRIENKDRLYQIIILTGGLNRSLTESFLHMNLFDLKEKDMPFYKIINSIRQAHQFYLNKIDLTVRLKNYLSSTIEETDSQKTYHDKLLEEFPSNHPKIIEIRELILKLFSSSARVLITGESGTGKKQHTDALLKFQNRNSNNILSINGVEVSKKENLEKTIPQDFFPKHLENQKEFFLVIDDIHELEMESQLYLMNLFQKNQEISENVLLKIICTTSKNLKQMIHEEKFNEGLYYFLNEFSIELLPLRKRKDDIQVLFEKFIKLFSILEKKVINDYEKKIIRNFEDYYWPGNIRELKNITHRMVLFSKSKQKLSVSEIPVEILDYSNQNDLLNNEDFEQEKKNEELSIKNIEKITIEKALKKANYNKEMAARALGISRASIYRKMKEYGIKI